MREDRTAPTCSRLSTIDEASDLRRLVVDEAARARPPAYRLLPARYSARSELAGARCPRRLMHKVAMSQPERTTSILRGAGTVPEYKKYIVGGEKERPRQHSGRTARAEGPDATGRSEAVRRDG
jgi:hypothetical protein